MLLAVSLALRRADAAAVIATAVQAKIADGWGHWRIAARIGRPASTVRGWLRAFTASAQRIAQVFAALVARDAPDAAALWPAPTVGVTGQALVVLAAYAAAVSARFGVGTLAWVVTGVAATHGRLFSGPWWSGQDQHELALTPARSGPPGSRPGPQALLFVGHVMN